MIDVAQLPSLAADSQPGSVPWQIFGWIALVVGIASAAWILWDILGRGNRQHMAVMNWVWPVTALYLGPFALWGYFVRDRQPPSDEQNGSDGTGKADGRLAWAFSPGNRWPITKGVSHCGAGCTLGDIVGEWVVYVTAWTIPVFSLAPANSLMAMYVVSFVLAWVLGIVFQYFSIVPMRDDVGVLDGLWLAIKADTLSIISFQAGLFGFMALTHLVLWQPPLSIASPTYWFMMQVGMIIGFFTSWPVNAWLIRRGWKEKM